MAAYEYVGRNFSVSADVVGAEMEKIEKRDGFVTNKSLLEAGRPDDSVLHGLFEWNDSKAAELYRLRQANDVITHIHIIVEEHPKQPYRGFVDIQESNGQTEPGRYINIKSAMANEETRKVLLSAALAEMKRFAEKYSQYKELSEVFEAINRVAERLQETA
jgi:hypothetical protein